MSRSAPTHDVRRLWGQVWEAGSSTAGTAGSLTDRMAVLAICLHNLGIEQEALGLGDEAQVSLEEAAIIAETYVGGEHPITEALRTTRNASRSSLRGSASVGRMRPRPASASLARRNFDSISRHLENVEKGRQAGFGNHPREPVRPRDRSQQGRRDAVLKHVTEGGEVQMALREWMRQHRARVMTLFRKWDSNNDAGIDRDEFHGAMRVLGVRAPAADLDGVFDSFDPDGSGYLDFQVF